MGKGCDPLYPSHKKDKKRLNEPTKPMSNPYQNFMESYTQNISKNLARNLANGKVHTDNQNWTPIENKPNMKTDRLKKVYENLNTTVWEFNNQEEFVNWLKVNEIEDRYDLADEVCVLAHTLLMEDGFNYTEFGIIATGKDEGYQSYEIVTDEDGKKVLTQEDAFWGESFSKFIEKINRQLDAEAETTVDDVIESYRNGNFTQAKGEIAEILEAGRDIINELLNEDRDRLETEFVLVQVARYLANNPSREARVAIIER